MLLAILGILFSMIIIWRACDGFEAASNYLGRNLSDGVKGATINAIGSSLPELLTALIGLLFLSDIEGFAFGVGATAGSAVFNSAVIPGLVILMVYLFYKKEVTVSRKVILRDGIALIFAEFVLIFLLSKSEVSWTDGVALISIYLMYIGGTIKSMETEPLAENEPEMISAGSSNRLISLITLDLEASLVAGKRYTTKNALALLGVSTFVIGIACYILVESCVAFSVELGIASYFVAVILAAAATSVPDTILSLKDAKNGNYDDAVANALGSNIFDICVALGLPLFLYSIISGNSISLSTSDESSITELRVLLLGLTVLITILLLLKEKVSKYSGIAMLFLYGFFASYVLGTAYKITWAISFSDYLHSFYSLLMK